MAKENFKGNSKDTLQKKFDDLKLKSENKGFKKFMVFHEEISSYSHKEIEHDLFLIKLDNSTTISNN